MEKFIPYEKLSKKKQRELDLMKRGSWGGLNPVTRKPKNPRAYDRRKAQSWKKDSGSALLFQIGPASRTGFSCSSVSTASPTAAASGNTGPAAAGRRGAYAG